MHVENKSLGPASCVKQVEFCATVLCGPKDFANPPSADLSIIVYKKTFCNMEWLQKLIPLFLQYICWKDTLNSCLVNRLSYLGV